MVREFKTILCPIDFSGASYHALEYAVRFATASGAKLIVPHILHDTMSPEFRPGGHAIPFTDVKRAAAAKLNEVWTEKMGSYANTSLIVEVGDPFSEILAIAEAHGADLLITATHGRTGLKHLLIGSVAEKLVRHAACPVFVVREGVA